MVVYVRNESGLLIGTATDLTLSTMNMLMKHRPLQLDSMGRLMQSPPDGVLNPEVRVVDWNPQPPAPITPRPSVPADGISEYDTRVILTALVHMFGGSVTIAGHEFDRAKAAMPKLWFASDDLQRIFLEVKD